MPATAIGVSEWRTWHAMVTFVGVDADKQRFADSFALMLRRRPALMRNFLLDTSDVARAFFAWAHRTTLGQSWMFELKCARTLTKFSVEQVERFAEDILSDARNAWHHNFTQPLHRVYLTRARAIPTDAPPLRASALAAVHWAAVQTQALVDTLNDARLDHRTRRMIWFDYLTTSS